jgi:hypothetical protein
MKAHLGHLVVGSPHILCALNYRVISTPWAMSRPTGAPTFQTLKLFFVLLAENMKITLKNILSCPPCRDMPANPPNFCSYYGMCMEATGGM